MRAAVMGTVLALVLAGCAGTGQPLAPMQADTPVFATKLINLASIGSQWMNQTNLVPNTQLNFTNQHVGTNATAIGAIASQVGTGAALADNATAQNIDNYIMQNQNQNQLVL